MYIILIKKNTLREIKKINTDINVMNYQIYQNLVFLDTLKSLDFFLRNELYRNKNIICNNFNLY